MAPHKQKPKLSSSKRREADGIDAAQQCGTGWADIKHFKPRDFTCTCQGLCGHPDVISADLVTKLDKIQDLIGMPLTVLSATRCAKFNRKSGGTELSVHLATGGVSHAADIRCPDAAFRFAFLTAALPLFKRIGIGKEVIHVDDDPDLPENVIWLC
jgi:Peptidase M15